ncbi:MAG: ATP synthase F1 subunit delta [Erysipelotrichaceae bacterium]|nr:ATP synthase F1 subunit delta [Erysipelotrichaceae bacterium]MDD3924662.1 ATP synthase F1 subunit delta [Erysipelotrichaceae bacterium]MDD4642631.1 ATP synthase F1 subunit delta [Erysipelotrichaceae bacterium]
MNKIASRYSLALLELAQEEDRLQFYCEQMAMVKEVFKQNPELLPFLNHYLIPKEDKKAVINRIFATDDNMSVVRFIWLIVDHTRVNLLQIIIDDFLDQAYLAQGIMIGKVYSIKKLDRQELKDIELAVANRVDKKVLLENIIDRELMAGVKVVIKDMVIDGSLKNRISLLKDSLLNRGD